MNTFKEYQTEARSFAIYPEMGEGSTMALAYTALGLAGESGEYTEKIKKRVRDGHIDTNACAKELGDVLWYLTLAANEIGYTLEEVARMNIIKLQSRKERGVIQGSGDER